MRKNDKIIIAIFFLIIGIAIAIQFRSIQSNYLSGLLPNKKFELLSDELKKLKKEKELKQVEYDEMKLRLDTIMSTYASNDTLIKDLNLQVDKLKKIVGLTDIKGSGIVLRIENDENSEQKVNIDNEFQYLLLVVNELNASGAEAISINSQRIVNNTEIRTVNQNMMINSNQISSPFTIKAIGNSNVLFSALNQRFGIVNILRERGLIVNLEQNELVEIPKYDGVISWEYAKTIGE